MSVLELRTLISECVKIQLPVTGGMVVFWCFNPNRIFFYYVSKDLEKVLQKICSPHNMLCFPQTRGRIKSFQKFLLGHQRNRMSYRRNFVCPFFFLFIYFFLIVWQKFCCINDILKTSEVVIVREGELCASLLAPASCPPGF